MVCKSIGDQVRNCWVEFKNDKEEFCNFLPFQLMDEGQKRVEPGGSETLFTRWCYQFRYYFIVTVHPIGNR